MPTTAFPALIDGRGHWWSVPEALLAAAGVVKRAYHWLRLIEGGMWHFASSYAKFSALARAVHGFLHYLWRNGGLVANYARRRRAGHAISTALVDSLVNSLLSKRFAKKQSMQWTPEGAHLLLQTRTRTLESDLFHNFRRWYTHPQLRASPPGVNGHGDRPGDGHEISPCAVMSFAPLAAMRVPHSRESGWV